MRYFGCALLAAGGVVYLVVAWAVLAGLAFTIDAPGSSQLSALDWMLVIVIFAVAPIALGLLAWWLIKGTARDR